MESLLYEQLYQYVLNEIRDGNLKQGDRVPSENELAQRFNVSRITSKKALEMLASQQIIQRVPGKGSFVSTSVFNQRNQSETTNERESAPINGSEIMLPQGLIGVLLPSCSDAYGIRLLEAIEHHCSQVGAQIILKLTKDDQEIEESAIRDMVQREVDGIIIYPGTGELYNQEILRLVLDDFPLVLVDKYLKGVSCCAVYTDNRRAAEELTQLVVDMGHEHIALVSAPPDHTSSIEERLQGYLSVVTKDGSRLTNGVMMTNWSTTGNIESEKRQLMEFVACNPQVTAFVASQYPAALLLLEVLTDLGKRVPEDCAIVCFDSPTDIWQRPYITYVRQNESLMGETAVKLLLAKIRGESVPIMNRMPFDIVYGPSTPAKGAEKVVNSAITL